MENRENGCIEFETAEGEKVFFFVLEETKINGINYLLVTEDDEEEEESEAYIMREIQDEDGQVIYGMVEDDTELEAVSKVFAELLEDIKFEM